MLRIGASPSETIGSYRTIEDERMTYELVSPHNSEIVAVATRNNNDVHLLTQGAGIGRNERCETIVKRTQYRDLD